MVFALRRLFCLAQRDVFEVHPRARMPFHLQGRGNAAEWGDFSAGAVRMRWALGLLPARGHVGGGCRVGVDTLPRASALCSSGRVPGSGLPGPTVTLG